jgi:hypothetical protein
MDMARFSVESNFTRNQRKLTFLADLLFHGNFNVINMGKLQAATRSFAKFKSILRYRVIVNKTTTYHAPLRSPFS